MAVAKTFITPFAKSGNRIVIPDAVQPGGEVSYTVGFGPDYERQLGVDPLAKNIERENFNQTLYDVTTALQELQAGYGTVPYSATLAAQLPGAVYPKGAIIPSTDGLGLWVATSATATDPETAGTIWQPLYATGTTAIALTNANVTLTALQAAKPFFNLTGVLTANISIIVPNWTYLWSVANNTTGAFTVTVKTAAGSGVVITQGTSSGVRCNGTNVLLQQTDFISPVFTGNPTCPTPANADNDTSIANSAFVQTAVNGGLSLSVAGGTDTTLTAAQYGVAFLVLTGVITANKNIIFPNLSGHWQVINNTTGAFTLTLKTAAGSGIVVTQGTSTSIFGDGANIGLQQSDFISPIFTGNPTAPTPAQFDADQSVVNSAFVQRALGNYSGLAAYGSSTALTAADAGKYINFSAVAVSQTLTLPAASSVPAGTAFFIQNTGQPFTLSRAGADTMSVSGSTLTTLLLNTGSQVNAVSNGAGFWYLTGTGTLGQLGDFGSNLVSAGYQKLPSGLVIQWGTTAVATSGDLVQTLPIAFPSLFMNVIVTQAYTAGSGSIGYAAANPTSLGTFTWRGSTVANAYQFIAIGK